jgi:hypothetical protein
MTKVKQQVVDMLNDIPDDKAIYILEMIKGLMLLYDTDSTSMVIREPVSSAMGIFKEYANIDLIPREKYAWGEAVREKYANHGCKRSP